MTDSTHDIIIVGGGTAGLVTAAGAVALGAKAAVIERAALGGECLWTACVPSKALIAFAARYGEAGRGKGEGWNAAVAWLRSARDRIAPRDSSERFRGLGVDVVLSPARLAGPGLVETETRTLSAKRIVLAMGSRPRVPVIPGLEKAGFLTHVTALEQPGLPTSMVILGGGSGGLEFAQTYQRLGVAVTLVEALPEILPNEDPEVGRVIREGLVREGITVHTGFRAVEVRAAEGGKTVTAENGKRVTADEVFVATGRAPNSEDAGLERAGVALDQGAVRVNRRLETTARGIWAAGDVTGGLAFTHVADYMARVVVQNALTPVKKTADYRVVPWVTFTDPEVGRVGLTADQAAARGERVQVYRADFADIDRAVVEGATTGFCKMVTRRDGTVLGATIVGRGAGELIMEVALAMRYGIRLPQLGSVMYPYPTLSEIIKRTAESWYRARYGDTRRGRLLRRIVRLWL